MSPTTEIPQTTKDSPPVTLITGSTEGIGLELARRYLAEGWRVITHGRNPAFSLAGAEGHLAVDLNLTDCASQILTGLEKLRVDHLDLLLHNAAAAWCGPISTQTEFSIQSLVQVNFAAPAAITHALFPLLKKCGGTVVFVSSVASAIPAPDYAVYAATKAALDGFARSLRVECQGTGVQVRVVWPGATRTRLHEKAGFSADKLGRMKMVTPAEAARRIHRRISRQTDGVLSVSMALATWICRKFPNLVDALVRRFGKRLWKGAKHGSANRKVVVTGFAEGIGLGIAKAWQRVGWKSAGIDIHPQNAASAARELQDDYHVADLTDPVQRSAAGDWIAAQQPAVVVHNAGINATGRFWEIPWLQQERVWQLNFLTPLLLTRKLCQLDPPPALVMISSLSKQLSYPGASVYAGTKDGLAHYARSLRAAGAAVLTVYPGPTRTVHARLNSPDNSKEQQRMDPLELGNRIVTAQQKGRCELIPGWKNKLLAWLGHWFAGMGERAMRKAIFEKLP